MSASSKGPGPHLCIGNHLTDGPPTAIRFLFSVVLTFLASARSPALPETRRTFHYCFGMRGTVGVSCREMHAATSDYRPFRQRTAVPRGVNAIKASTARALICRLSLATTFSVATT